MSIVINVFLVVQRKQSRCVVTSIHRDVVTPDISVVDMMLI